LLGFLFYVVVGLSGWTKGQDPFDDFLRISLVLLSKTWTLAIHLSSWLDNDKGGLATSVMPLRLPYCSTRDEESKEEEAAFAFEITPVAGYRGKDL
jgi:hypothetical protein